MCAGTRGFRPEEPAGGGTYQAVHAAQRVVGVVQGVGQLVHAVVGLAVAIETHTHCDAAERGGRAGDRLVFT